MTLYSVRFDVGFILCMYIINIYIYIYISEYIPVVHSCSRSECFLFISLVPLSKFISSTLILAKGWQTTPQALKLEILLHGNLRGPPPPMPRLPTGNSRPY